jgi:hypothetical protein
MVAAMRVATTGCGSSFKVGFALLSLCGFVWIAKVVEMVASCRTLAGQSGRANRFVVGCVGGCSLEEVEGCVS